MYSAEEMGELNELDLTYAEVNISLMVFKYIYMYLHVLLILYFMLFQNFSLLCGNAIENAQMVYNVYEQLQWAEQEIKVIIYYR